MLSAIKDIGRLTLHKPGSAERTMDQKVLLILLNTKTDKYTYSGTEIEDFGSEKIKKYLFKEGSSKGNAPSPFCPLTEPQKTYKKIYGWIKQCKDIKDDALKAYTPLIDGAFKALVDSKDTIIADITNEIKCFQKRTRRFLTIKLDGKYLGEYNAFREAADWFAETKRKKSAGTGVCSICGLPDKEVSGKTDVFRFYTIDKPGFITGGFREVDAWKNYPVCLECKTLLENGKKFLENNLRFNFVYGLSYYLIPRLLIGNKDVLEKIINILSDTSKKISLKERRKKRITDDENEILEYLSEEKDILTLNFLFLQRQQSAERILLLIEDVFPSRIRRIFDAKDYVDKIFDNDSDRGFTFGSIRTFFFKSDENKKTSDLNKYFLQIVDSVFKGRKLDLSFLMKFYMAIIRKEFINDGYFSFRVKDAMMDTIFFENLDLISFREAEHMEENMFSSIFDRFGKSFSNPAKRGIFLLGVLTQLLLYKQWADRKAKPFMKKLKGLKMDERDIKALLPEVQNKLEEYDSFDRGKRLIASEASKYLLEAGDNWKMSVDEINFYFACGMNLSDNVADIAYSKIKKEE